MLVNLFKYYLQHTEFLIDFVCVNGIFIHTYYYQILDKSSEINFDNLIHIYIFFIFASLINDFCNVLAKFLSREDPLTRKSRMITYVILTISIVLCSILIKGLVGTIGNYPKSFMFCVIAYIVSNSLKCILTLLCKTKYVSDILKLLDTVFMINMVLVAITDPFTNTEERPNEITFYEVYFRYMEFHVLILAFLLIYNDKNIDQDVNDKIFSTSAIIGRYDCYRFSVILILAHYFFIFINGLAFSIKYWKSFSSLFVSFYLISKYRQRKMIEVYIAISILLIWNISFYIMALKDSAPNVGFA